MAEETAKVEDTKTEEAKVEDTEALDSAIKKGEDETKDEIPQEIVDANKKFDDLMDSDEDTATDDKPAEEAEEKSADDKKADDDDSGDKTKAAEQTAKEKEIETTANAIEEQAVAEANKTVEQKATEKAEADAKAKAEADEKAKTEEKPYDCGLPTEGEADYDEDLVKTINKQGQEMQDAKKATEKENAELRKVINQQANQRYGDWLDNKITGLGEDFHEVLGEGEYEDLEPASDQAENRVKLGNRMSLISKAYQKLGQPVPSRTKLFNSAVSYLHKEIVNKSKTEAETVAKLKDRHGQVIGKGSKKASALAAASSIQKKNAEFDAKLDED